MDEQRAGEVREDGAAVRNRMTQSRRCRHMSVWDVTVSSPVQVLKAVEESSRRH